MSILTKCVIISLYCFIIVCNLTCGRMGYYNHFKRFDSGLLSEGLPMWLEKREEFRNPFNYQDISKAWKERNDLEVDELNRIISQSEIHRPLSTYFDQQIKYAYPDEFINRDQRAKPAFGSDDALATNGLRSYMHWQPAVVGSVCAVLGVLVIAAVGTIYQKRKLQMKSSLSQDEEDILENSKLSNKLLSLNSDDDRKLAQSAQMYHYQHQKQQMLALEKVNDHTRTSDDDDSEDDIDEGDFTVYECPGLANTGEIEVENPLFDNDAGEKVLNTSGSSGELIGCSDLEEHFNEGATTSPSTQGGATSTNNNQ
uniref:Neural proliferation differentiation and control protein 1 n=1 Tax=Trichobilharzia regenti TaxID=157069 RepID=A0AA85JBZ5_TRIRE|nr:unnamed protein product [Trichobilharzia regenti]